MHSDRQFTLYISGGAHITRSKSRVEGLPIEADDADVVFEEDVTHNPPERTSLIKNWLAMPVMLFAIGLYLAGLSLASVLGLSDSGIVYEFQNTGADVVKTDENFHRLLGDQRLIWGVCHWGMALYAFVGLPVWLRVFTPDVLAALSFLPQSAGQILATPVSSIVWFAGVGLVMGGFFIAGTLEARNYAILNQIEQYIKDNPDTDTGCIVIGRAHIPHFQKLVENSDSVFLG